MELETETMQSVNAWGVKRLKQNAFAESCSVGTRIWELWELFLSILKLLHENNTGLNQPDCLWSAPILVRLSDAVSFLIWYSSKNNVHIFHFLNLEMFKMPWVLGALFPDQEKLHARRRFPLSGVPSTAGSRWEDVGVLVLSFVLLLRSQEGGSASV